MAVVIAYQDGGNNYYGTAIVGVSGTSISFGASNVFESATCVPETIVYDQQSKSSYCLCR